MTPIEKANQIIDKFYDVDVYDLDTPNFLLLKQYALICVDEIINSCPTSPIDPDWDECGSTHQYYYETRIEDNLNYWNDVKKEIEKL